MIFEPDTLLFAKVQCILFGAKKTPLTLAPGRDSGRDFDFPLPGSGPFCALR
jgi:hypothetical protein